MVRQSTVAGTLCALVSVMFATVAAGSRPADSILPATTKGFLSVASTNQLADQFNRCELGQLVNDPAMKPFVEDVKRQLRQQGLKQLEQLELSWEELDGLPTGEVALAAIQISNDEAAVALVVDVRGHGSQSEALLTKIAD